MSLLQGHTKIRENEVQFVEEVNEDCASNFECDGICRSTVNVTDVREEVFEDDIESDEYEREYSGDEEDNRDDDVILVQGDQDSCDDDDEFRTAREKVKKHAQINRTRRKKLKEALQQDEARKEGEQNIERNKLGIRGASVYHDSSDDISVHSDDLASDADTAQRRVVDRTTLYDPFAPFVDFYVGQEFASVRVLRSAIKRYSIVKRYAVKYIKNDMKKMLVKCCDNGCSWRLYCSFVNNIQKWAVKSYESSHSCKVTRFNKRVTSKVIAEKLKDIILEMPNIKTKTMIKLIWLQLRADVTPMQCRKAKHLLFKDKNKEFLREYGDVWKYVEELKRSNPGTTVELQNFFPAPGAQPHFKRLYICFAALKKEFLEGCRPFIGVDGCFLKGICKGELLSAVGRDANNQMYPIAWALVESESTSSWTWFLDLLSKDLNLGSGKGWTIMSDQQKGLIAAVKDVIPEVEHRMCVRHLYANWRKNYKGDELKVKYWAAAKASNLCKMWEALSDLAELSPSGYVSMSENLHSRYWCRTFFNFDSCCDLVDNNICETFNGVILEARSKPVISMLEDIRIYIMKRIVENREYVHKWKHPCAPRIHVKLERNREMGEDWRVQWNGEDGFEVSLEEERHVVMLGSKSCTCRRWELRGIPCPHACACIEHENLEIMDYVYDWFKVPKYNATYSYMLQPVRGIADWPISLLIPLLPPHDRRMPGRPKLHKRKREEWEKISSSKNNKKVSKVGVRMVCSVCGKDGHNKRTCKQKLIEVGERVQDDGMENLTVQEMQADLAEQRSRPSCPGSSQGKTRMKRGPTGFGLYINPETGEQVLNPGTCTKSHKERAKHAESQPQKGKNKAEIDATRAQMRKERMAPLIDNGKKVASKLK